MSYRSKSTLYAAAGMGSYYDRPGFHAEYATAGMGAYTDLPGFRDAYKYATAGLGATSGSSVTLPVTWVQRVLMQKGFGVGSTGADGIWGPNTRAAFDRALGSGSSSQVNVSGGNITMPTAMQDSLIALPDRELQSGGGGGGGTRTPSPSPGSELTESDLPTEEPPGAGINWDEIWPWAVGGGALLLVGGGLVYAGRRKRAMKANRRRRRRRSSKRRRSSRRRR